MPIELFTFRVPRPLKPGKTYLTRWKMTRAEAAENHPGAECVESSREVRNVDDGSYGPSYGALIAEAGGGAPGWPPKPKS